MYADRHAYTRGDGFDDVACERCDPMSSSADYGNALTRSAPLAAPRSSMH